MHVEAATLDPLTIASRQWDYTVSFTQDIAGALAPLLLIRDAFVVLDEAVALDFEEPLRPLLQRFPVRVVPATEITKSLEGVAELTNWLLEQRATRSATLIAIGGGCIQDLVSFTSHIYYRGIDWIFVPTTVLAQADSCIGAKSGINVLPFKNQIGALHAPREIRIAAAFLQTLPDIELASGYGEIVKLSVTSSRSFLSQLEAALSHGGIRNPELLPIVRASLMAKQLVIEEDEYESDLRRILNYGHSFGHALEAISGHTVPHGLGVLWGIDIINWLGVRWGITDPDLAARLDRLIREHFEYVLPFHPTAEQLVDMIRRDKKVAHGMMNFAVLVTEGEFVIDQRPIDDVLLAEVTEYLETDYVFRRN